MILHALAVGARPWLLGGAVAAVAGAWIWWQSGTIHTLRDRVAAATARATAAEGANAILAMELDRQAAERARNEAALVREAADATVRAEARGRAIQEIRSAPDADAPFSPAVAAALRRLYGGPAAAGDRDQAD